MRCAPCGRRLPTSEFSKRQLSRPREAKCKSCLQALESAERTTAASSAAVSAGEQQQQQQQQLFHCSGCNQELAQVRFSRTQRVQKADHERRCISCMAKGSSLAAADPAEITSTIPAAPSTITSAATEPNPAVELQRYKATKKLRRLLSTLVSRAGAEPPVLAFDRWVSRSMLSRQQRSKQSRHAEPLLPPDGDTCNGLVKDLSRVLKADVAQKIASDLASHAKKAVERIQAMHEEHEALEADHGGGRAQGGHGGSSSASRAAIDVATGSAVVQERGAMLRLSLSGTPKPYVEISKEVKTPKMTPHRPIRSACSVFLTQSESPASHGRPARSTLTSWRDVMRNRLCCRVACFARVRCRSFCDIRASVRTDIKQPYLQQVSTSCVRSLGAASNASPRRSTLGTTSSAHASEIAT